MPKGMIRTGLFLVVAFMCAFLAHAARAQDAADLVTRLNRLEGMLRDLTGQVEQLQYRNQQLTQQVQRLQEQLQGGAPAAAAAPRPGAQYSPPPPAQYSPPPPAQYSQAQPQYAQPPQQGQYSPPPPYPAANAPPPDSGRHDAFNPAQNPTAPGAPRTLGTSTAATEPPPVYDRPDGQGVPRQAGAPLDLSSLSGPQAGAQPGQLPPPPPTNASAPGTAVATLPPTNSPKDEYDLAYGYFLHKDYTPAAQTFGAFLRKYPSDRLAPEAQYWLGESLFQSQQYHDAAEAFLTVSTKYETTARAPDALLRLGQSLAALGEKEAACASLGEVLRKYPRASLTVKQNVDREQKRVHC
jgi:tol-pal system protein YbgF